MKTQIFEYLGYLGVQMDMVSGKFLNDPTAYGQLGTVIPTSEIEITKEAKEVIRKAKRSEGSFAELMLIRHDSSIISTKGKSSIGVLGFNNVFLGNDFEISSDCDLSVLDDCIEVTTPTPQDFIEFIDSQLASV